MRIVFRVDASRTIGTGHIARVLPLAKALRMVGAEVLFLCRDFPFGAADFAADEGFDTVRLPIDRGHEDTWLGAAEQAELDMSRKALAAAGPFGMIIIDHYALGEKYEKMARAFCGKIVVIDDLANRQHECDALIDMTWQPPGAADLYERLIPPGAERMYGPSFAILREEFRVQSRTVRTNGLKRLFIFFGGSDPTDLTLETLEALSCLLDSQRWIHVDVVVGRAYGGAERLMRQFANRVNVHIQTNKMAELMASADLAIGAAGFTSWERAWLGLPAIVFTVAANQQRNAAALEQSGAGIYLGSSSEIDKSKLAFTTKYLSSDVKALSSISSKAIALSGPAGSFGTDKVVERLNSLVEGIA